MRQVYFPDGFSSKITNKIFGLSNETGMYHHSTYTSSDYQNSLYQNNLYNYYSNNYSGNYFASYDQGYGGFYPPQEMDMGMNYYVGGHQNDLNSYTNGGLSNSAKFINTNLGMASLMGNNVAGVNAAKARMNPATKTRGIL